MYHVNIRAQFFLTQKAVAQMEKAGGGAVCNVTSIHGVSGAPEHSVYAGTKGAIIAYTRSLGVELAHKNIRVNAIAPGWITVENYAKALPGLTLRKPEESGSDSACLWDTTACRSTSRSLRSSSAPTMPVSSSARRS